MAKTKIVAPETTQEPAYTLPLPAHVDGIDIHNLDCQTRDLVGSALGCGFRVTEGLLFADDGRAFKVEVIGRELVLT